MENSEFLIAPDLTEAVDIGGAIPAGVYNTRVTGVEVKTTQAGAKRLLWTLTIFGAEGELSRYNNWNVKHSTMLSGPGAGMLKAFYKACKNEEFAGGAYNWQDLVGSEIQATLKEGMRDGQPTGFAEVKGVKSIKLPF
jgi:hypothetical protein